MEKLSYLKELETREKTNKAEMEEVSFKIQHEIDTYLSKLDELLKRASSVEPIYDINKEVSDLILNEIALQAKFNTEVWKLEKICKSADDESAKIAEIIS